MKALLIGDVVGSPGRKVLAAHLPPLIREHGVDYTVVNVENIAGGFGVTGPTCQVPLDAGAQVLTSGNHIWDKREVLELFPSEPRLLRPANFAPGVPGEGVHVGSTAGGTRVAVVNLQGRVFMPPGDCPFRAADGILEELRDRADVILVDFHAEATSEKVAMGWYLDGRVAAVVGTHTHVPTADERVLPGGTAYITDLGMTGPYDSVIGVDRKVIVSRFLDGLPARFETAKHDPRMCGVLVDIDESTGKARSISRFMIPGPS
jgi:metallophosphoesterase (TIGR00282 family)